MYVTQRELGKFFLFVSSENLYKNNQSSNNILCNIYYIRTERGEKRVMCAVWAIDR